MKQQENAATASYDCFQQSVDVAITYVDIVPWMQWVHIIAAQRLTCLPIQVHGAQGQHRHCGPRSLRRSCKEEDSECTRPSFQPNQQHTNLLQFPALFGLVSADFESETMPRAELTPVPV